jgi:ubiquinone/menaquinone biosynthesis C-methylase UbiE
MLCSVSVFDHILKQIEVAREYYSDLDSVEFTQDSETDLSFHDGTFDSVTSTNVLDYIVDIDGVVAELRRVLRKGGRFCTISRLWDHHRFHRADPAVNDRILHMFRDYCPHQMLSLELPNILPPTRAPGGNLPIQFGHIGWVPSSELTQL